MLKGLKNIDTFTRNIIIVFTGTTLVNLFNLLYQLLIAHRLSPADFAAFNSLLSIFMLISSPLGTLQMAVAKYCAEFNAQNQIGRIKFLLFDLIGKTSLFAIFTFLFFWFILGYIMNVLRIPLVSCAYILALLLAFSWLTPVFSGAVQGLEFFGWLAFGSVLSGAFKLALAFAFVLLGYNVAGALGALLISTLIGLVILYFPLGRFISRKVAKEGINYKDIITYLFPIAISYFSFIALISFDMVLVKYFFSAQDSGIYSLAQMVGKIFLFLPGAVSIVMFPRTSGLKAKNMDTVLTLKRSLLYVLGLCVFAILLYNFFPNLVLKILTGKAYPESVLLGRLFSVSMSFFALLFILISYFLSIKDLRFIKHLVLFTGLQVLAIILFHRSLMQITLVLCVNAILLFLIHLILAYKKELSPPKP